LCYGCSDPALPPPPPLGRSFKLFVATRLRSPRFPSDVLRNVTVVNWAITRGQLTELLVGTACRGVLHDTHTWMHIVTWRMRTCARPSSTRVCVTRQVSATLRVEHPELEAEHAVLTRQRAKGEADLAGLEDAVLAAINAASTEELLGLEEAREVRIGREGLEEAREKAWEARKVMEFGALVCSRVVFVKASVPLGGAAGERGGGGPGGGAHGANERGERLAGGRCGGRGGCIGGGGGQWPAAQHQQRRRGGWRAGAAQEPEGASWGRSAARGRARPALRGHVATDPTSKASGRRCPPSVPFPAAALHCSTLRPLSSPCPLQPQESHDAIRAKVARIEDSHRAIAAVRTDTEKYFVARVVPFFFCLADLAAVRHTYQFGLHWFMRLFSDALITCLRNSSGACRRWGPGWGGGAVGCGAARPGCRERAGGPLLSTRMVLQYARRCRLSALLAAEHVHPV
jgi:hypothetical protein